MKIDNFTKFMLAYDSFNTLKDINASSSLEISEDYFVGINDINSLMSTVSLLIDEQIVDIDKQVVDTINNLSNIKQFSSKADIISYILLANATINQYSINQELSEQLEYLFSKYVQANPEIGDIETSEYLRKIKELIIDNDEIDSNVKKYFLEGFKEANHIDYDTYLDCYNLKTVKAYDLDIPTNESNEDVISRVQNKDLAGMISVLEYFNSIEYGKLDATATTFELYKSIHGDELSNPSPELDNILLNLEKRGEFYRALVEEGKERSSAISNSAKAIAIKNSILKYDPHIFYRLPRQTIIKNTFGEVTLSFKRVITAFNEAYKNAGKVRITNSYRAVSDYMGTPTTYTDYQQIDYMASNYEQSLTAFNTLVKLKKDGKLVCFKEDGSLNENLDVRQIIEDNLNSFKKSRIAFHEDRLEIVEGIYKVCSRLDIPEENVVTPHYKKQIFLEMKDIAERSRDIPESVKALFNFIFVTKSSERHDIIMAILDSVLYNTQEKTVNEDKEVRKTYELASRKSKLPEILSSVIASDSLNTNADLRFMLKDPNCNQASIPTDTIVINTIDIDDENNAN